MNSAFKPGFGEKLRQARETQGLTHADVVTKLKLGPRQIESLEAESLDQLPGEVFTRGFVRNYARLLGLDPEQLIVPLDPHAVVAETLTAPSEGVLFSSPGLRRWVLLPLLALGFFVALVAILYYWLRQGEDALVSTPVAPVPAILTPAAPPAPLPLAADPLPAPAVAPADTAPVMTPVPALPPAGASPAATSSAPVPAPEAAKPVTPAAAAPTAPGKPVATPSALATPPAPPLVTAKPADSAPAANHSLPPGQHLLRLNPALDAWIQIVDGQGKRFSKLVRAGSSESFAGVAPFKLVVGEAAQVQLTYDGHAIDLSPFIGQKVARLTLE